MNKNQDFKIQLEKLFWHKTIPMLSSGNKAVATIVNIGLYIQPRLQRANFITKAIFWGCMGLSLGLGIGVLIN